jgi:hypothetical protein
VAPFRRATMAVLTVGRSDVFASEGVTEDFVVRRGFVNDILNGQVSRRVLRTVRRNGEVRPVAESPVQAERAFLWDWRRGNNNDERISVECDLGLDRYLSEVYELMFVPVDKLCSLKVEMMAVLLKRKREEGSAEGSWVRLVEGVARVEGQKVDGCLEVEVWMGFGKRST